MVRAFHHHRELARARFPAVALASYQPTSIEIATLIGSFGLFFTCFLLFCRFVPVIAIAEIKGVLEPDAPAVRLKPATSSP